MLGVLWVFWMKSYNKIFDDVLEDKDFFFWKKWYLVSLDFHP